jgi:cyclopropane fatty-acyl-phospholipid synthase-like methyltransferase
MVFAGAQEINQRLEKHVFASLPLAPCQTNTSVGEFYDTKHIDIWQKVLGRKMHYHFGIFEDPVNLPSDDAGIDAAFDRAVSELYPYFPIGGRVYDIGCGWGGTALQLAQALECRVEGITASKTQFRYCASQDLLVRYGDVESTLPAGYFDCMLMLESLCHIRNKLRLLRILRTFGRRLILREHCQDHSPASINFGSTMYMISSTKLRTLLEQAGWHITYWRNRRAESMPSVQAWHNRLQMIPQTQDTHLETLRFFCDRLLTCADEWADSNPLIEVVAE